jgi:hypothetical protein
MQELKDLQELSDAEKQKIVDQVNEMGDEDISGNTVITSIADHEEFSKQLDSLTPKQMYEQNVASNFRSAMKLDPLLDQMSKKNLKKLLLAIVKLPEPGFSIKFGGTSSKASENAFIHAQVCANTKTYIQSVDAVARARYEKLKLIEKQQQEESNEEA